MIQSCRLAVPCLSIMSSTIWGSLTKKPLLHPNQFDLFPKSSVYEVITKVSSGLKSWLKKPSANLKKKGRQLGSKKRFTKTKKLELLSEDSVLKHSPSDSVHPLINPEAPVLRNATAIEAWRVLVPSLLSFSSIDRRTRLSSIQYQYMP